MATQIKSKDDTEEMKQSALVEMSKVPELAALPSRKEANRPRNIEALRALREWDNFTPEEIQEQKETWKFLKKALDEDRLSPNRPHFPADGDEAS